MLKKASIEKLTGATQRNNEARFKIVSAIMLKVGEGRLNSVMKKLHQRGIRKIIKERYSKEIL